MENDCKKPLDGFRDIFGKEARVRQFLFSKIAELFQLWGYELIEIPLIEKTSIFNKKIIGGSPWPEWDKKGMFYISVNDYIDSYENLAIRENALLVPEGTVSISRWIALRLAQNKKKKGFLPLKIFYLTPCFRNELLAKLSSTKGRSFFQVGLEILGADNINADLENMLLITKGLLFTGVSVASILVRLSDIRIFKSLCMKSNIVKEDNIISLKESLDAIAEARAEDNLERLPRELNAFWKTLNHCNLSSKLKEKWKLYSEYKGVNIPKNIIRALECPKVLEGLNYLSKRMQDFGIPVIIDLAVVRSHEYYTATVYEVDVSVKGKKIVEIAGGGRYNKLIGHFFNKPNVTIPATGFAYGLERLYQLFCLMESKSNYQEIIFWLNKNSADLLICSTSGNYKMAYNAALKLRKKGIRVDVYVGDNLSKKAISQYSLMRKIPLMEVK